MLTGDKEETDAIKTALGTDNAKNTPISSTKSMIGHLLGAAGGVEAVFCALSIKDNVIPPTINLNDQDPECDLDYVPINAREADIEVAMSNSFGFGGTNGTTAMCAPRNELAISRHRSTCCGVCTVAGLKPGNPRWQNQDSYIISEAFQRQTNQRCYGVLDGHGEIGHLVSKRCSQQLCEHFVKSQLDMSLAFRLMQEVELRA